jgi:hypothetical protein
MQITSAAAKYFRQLRTYTNGQTKNMRVGDLMGRKVNSTGKRCIECGGHVPVYTNYYCEDHWKEALNKKLEEDEHGGENSSNTND